MNGLAAAQNRTAYGEVHGVTSDKRDPTRPRKASSRHQRDDSDSEEDNDDDDADALTASDQEDECDTEGDAAFSCRSGTDLCPRVPVTLSMLQLSMGVPSSPVCVACLPKV